MDALQTNPCLVLSTRHAGCVQAVRAFCFQEQRSAMRLLGPPPPPRDLTGKQEGDENKVHSD